MTVDTSGPDRSRPGVQGFGIPPTPAAAPRRPPTSITGGNPLRSKQPSSGRRTACRFGGGLRRRRGSGQGLEEPSGAARTGQCLPDAAVPASEGSCDPEATCQGQSSGSSGRLPPPRLPPAVSTPTGACGCGWAREGVPVQPTDSGWRVLVNACFPLGSRE